jgi:pyruvate dehydrogenase (quinone)
VLNAGQRVAILIGQGARGAADEVAQVAAVLGAGVAKALLGKDVLSDELPFVTGSIGLLGTRPSYELMRDCDTLLIVGPTSRTASSCRSSARLVRCRSTSTAG